MSEARGMRGEVGGCVVAIEAASIPGGAAHQFGSAIIIGPHHLLTCAHVVATLDGKGPGFAELRIADSDARVSLVHHDRHADLALLHCEGKLEGRTAHWLDSESAARWLTKGRPWSAVGYDTKTQQLGCAKGLSWLVNTNNDVQVHGGIPKGYSGGALSPSKDGGDLCVGLLLLGGESAATSRAVLADALQRFLDSCNCGLELARVAWLPPPIGFIDDFSDERSRHKQRFGREDLLVRLRELLDFDGWVILKGGWGVGKSAVLHYLLQELEQKGPVPHHVIRRGLGDWDQPSRVADNLSNQLRWLFAEAEALPPEASLLALLQVVSKQVLLPHNRRLTVVVDGLDEIAWQAEDNPLRKCLPRPLPPRVTFVVASRPADPHLTLFVDQRCVELNLDEERVLQRSSADACQQYLVALGTPSDVARQLSDAVEGKFLICEKMLGSVAAGQGGLSAEQLLSHAKGGLSGLFALWWAQRVTETGDGLKEERINTGLAYLCAAREGLPSEVLERLCKTHGPWSVGEFRKITLSLLRSTSLASGETFAIDHDSLRDFFLGIVGNERIQVITRQLADTLCDWSPESRGFGRRYALRHGLRHWRELRDWSKFEALALDATYLEALCTEVGVDALMAELDQALTASGAGVASALRTVQRYVRARADVLRLHPGILGQDFEMWCRVEGVAAREVLQRVGVSKVQMVGGAVRPEGADMVLRGHWEAVVHCVLTPDGARAVSASEDRTLRVWDLNTGKCLHTLDGHSSWVMACVLTPDGARGVSTSGDRTLRVWDLNTGKCLHTLDGHSSEVMACVLTPDGARAVSASEDHTLRVWDLNTGKCLHTLDGHSGSVTACVLTPDGARAVSASEDHTLRVWDLNTGKCLHSLRGHSSEVRACVLTPDGARAVSASEDNTLRVWDLNTGKCLHTLDGHSSWVMACVLTPDGARAVSASLDHTLRVWDLNTGKCLHTLDGHSSWVMACVLTPDGARAVSASLDHTLRVWDLNTGKCLHTLDGHFGSVTACVLTPDGARGVSTSWDRTLRVWDLNTGKCLHTLDGHFGSVTACVLTPDGARGVSTSWDRTLRVWDLNTGKCLHTWDGHLSEVRACVLTPDGARAVSASWDRTLRVWDLNTGKRLHSLRGHSSEVTTCVLTPDGARGVSTSKDNTLRVWDLNTGKCLHTLDGHLGPVTTCVLTPDGARGVSTSGDRTLRVWDLNTGKCLHTLDGHSREVRACVLTPDGARGVSTSGDRTLRVWDLNTGKCLHWLRGHWGLVTACVLTPDGARAVSASEDNTFRVWDLNTGKCLHTWDGHWGSVTTCVLTPDGARAVSASDDHTLRVWDLNTGKCLHTLDGHLGSVTACVLTPDGARAVSASDDHTLRVWDLNTGECLYTLDGHGGFHSCVISLDGKLALSAGYNITLHWLDLERGTCLYRFAGYHAFRALAVSSSGRIIAGDEGGNVWILDASPELWPRGFL